jgi:hypothetical protein
MCVCTCVPCVPYVQCVCVCVCVCVCACKYASVTLVGLDLPTSDTPYRTNYVTATIIAILPGLNELTGVGCQQSILEQPALDSTEVTGKTRGRYTAKVAPIQLPALPNWLLTFGTILTIEEERHRTWTARNHCKPKNYHWQLTRELHSPSPSLVQQMLLQEHCE